MPIELDYQSNISTTQEIVFIGFYFSTISLANPDCCNVMYLHLHLHQSVARFLGMVWTTIHDMLVQEQLQICYTVADFYTRNSVTNHANCCNAPAPKCQPTWEVDLNSG